MTAVISTVSTSASRRALISLEFGALVTLGPPLVTRTLITCERLTNCVCEAREDRERKRVRKFGLSRAGPNLPFPTDRDARLSPGLCVAMVRTAGFEPALPV